MNRPTQIVIAQLVIALTLFAADAHGSMSGAKVLQDENTAIERKCMSEGCTQSDLEKYQENKSDLDSLKEKFRLGVALGFEAYGQHYVGEAETVGPNKVVRVVDSQDYKPSLWVETHYVWNDAGKKMGFTHSAPGFYVGLRVLGANTDALDALSLGLLWSFKRTAMDDVPPKGQMTDSLNIGIGPVWHKTRQFAAGIIEGKPLPAEYTGVKFDSRDELSWMLMVSAGF